MVAITALALAAAFLFALSAFLQQRAARMIIGADTASLRDASGVKRLLGRLVRNGSWLTGWLTNLGGVGTQAAALKVGSVAAVQPMMAAQLLFVLSLASGEQRRRPSRRDWLSALAVCAGLVLLLTADASSLTGEPHRNRVFMATVCVVSLVLILRQVSRHTFPWLAGLLVGVAAGLCHALNAVYLKLTVEDLFPGGVLATLFDWPVYALAATATERNVVGTDSFCQRSATARRRRHGLYQPGRQLRIGSPRLRRTCSPRPRRAVGHRRVRTTDRLRHRGTRERVKHAAAVLARHRVGRSVHNGHRRR
jgi:drug/metabolite transporter (DMT)-like permease